MEEKRYDIIFNDTLVCENVALPEAFIMIEGLTVKYYKEIEYAPHGIQLVYHGALTGKE